MSTNYTEIVREVHKEWTKAFSVRDLDRLVSLYAANTAFWGSTNDLYKDPAGVRTYFLKLPASYKSSRFQEPHIVVLGPGAFAASGFVVFTRQDDGQDIELPYRMTHVFINEDGAWKIATHHASPQFASNEN